MAAVWLTSRLTSKSSLESRMAMAATFMPMELSPGRLVKIGHAAFVGGAQDAVSLRPSFSLALGDVSAQQVVKLVGAHRLAGIPAPG